MATSGHAPLSRTGDGRLAVVLGLGRFGGGRAAARYLARHDHRVRVVDRAPREALAESVRALADLDLELRLGTEDPSVLDGADLLVVNPAIPPQHPLLAEARRRGLPCEQELGLFLEDFPGRVVLVTGTNGKSSTATLLHRALTFGGHDALLGGNIGNSLLDEEDRWHRQQIAVVEISSFQLERLANADTYPRVEGAVFTPVTRDHLDRHGTLAAYHAAKARAAEVAREFVVHQADDPIAAAFPAGDARRLTHGPAESSPALDAFGDPAGWQWLGSCFGGPRCLFHARALLMQGDFQAANARAALLAAVALGAAPGRAALGLVTTPPLPYRLQQLGRLDGRPVFDNGVSTAVESTVSALRGLRPPIHWVGGGKSKEGPEALPAQTAELAPHLAGAHLFGTIALDLAAALRAHGIAVTVHEHLVDALDAAAAAAPPDATLLFSPAFASFDQWPNFRARAEAFRSWFRRHPGRRGPATT